MERPPCELKLASRARTPRGVRAGAVGAAFRSYSCLWAVLLELNEPLIRLATRAMAGGPGSSPSSSTEVICGAIASNAKATSPIANSRGDHQTRFRKWARVRLLR
jgi:hypothetical protein